MSKKEPIDHQQRRGGPYDAKPEVSDQERQKRSESMKAFNRKTGRVTQIANTFVSSRRLSKMAK